MIPSSQLKVHIFLLIAVICSGVHSTHYMGCYREGLSIGSLLPEANIDFGQNLTPKMCVDNCRSGGYSYAGVEEGSKCSCSNQRPHFTQLAREDSDCNFPCNGNPIMICGGKWRVGVYALNDQGVNFVKHMYKGCFENIHRNEDVLTSVYTKFPDILTPELCVGHCFRLGYDYAAVHDKDECHCGNRIEGTEVSTEKCKKECRGYEELKCGDKSKSSVYHTNARDIRQDIAADYQGCFKDSLQSRAFGMFKPFPQLLTPRVCVDFCHSNGYTFAALQYKDQCFCGNAIRGDLTAEGECDMSCAGDSRHICGGRYRNSVYKLPSRAARVFVGCFSDDANSRTLPHKYAKKTGSNSPAACIDHCHKWEYSYAGVQFGYECFCGNELRMNREKTNDVECSSKTCPGDKSLKCGGQWRLLVYTTGR